MPRRQHIPPPEAPQQHQTSNQNNPTRRSQASHNHGHKPLTPLARLLQEEAKHEKHKDNVAKFGAGWIRPPGIAKTYQARMDEEAEMKEQMELARREAVMLEMQQAAAAQNGLPNEGAEGEEEEEEERDLDDDVPDADALEEDLDDDDSDDVSTADEYTETSILQTQEGEVTFNEESLLEGSVDGDGQVMLALEDAELVGRLQDQRDLGMDVGEERDLDEDVPEAGSYEHTDTEEEDDSTEGEEESETNVRVQGFSNGRSRRSLGRSDGRGRRSLASEDSEMLGSSSFVGSSPAMARGPGRGNAFRDRMHHARRGRG
ncbi:hypothetical protein BLS_006831 [Venturia inaequalis]|nr:hypothetical protein BLS_006831 [Venturia inaequalis]